MFGGYAITNYLHIYFRLDTLWECLITSTFGLDKIHGFEHKMGAIRCYGQRRTQRGGHSGKSGLNGRNFSQAEAIYYDRQHGH